jgi:hypothetical protein
VPGDGLYNALAGVQLAIGLIFLITAIISLILMKNWVCFCPLPLINILRSHLL